jgi:8-oxo-dGTP diphosphatase
VTVRPEVCVGAIVVRDGAVLLVRRGRGAGAGLWSVPGGRVEPSESLAQAVERELAEETGLHGQCGDLVGIAERIDATHHYVILDYWVDGVGGEAVAGDDAAEVAWVPLPDVADRDDLVPGLATFLRDHGIC